MQAILEICTDLHFYTIYRMFTMQIIVLQKKYKYYQKSIAVLHSQHISTPPSQSRTVLNFRLLMSYIYDISSLRANDLT
jgi:hypothetical protein